MTTRPQTPPGYVLDLAPLGQTEAFRIAGRRVAAVLEDRELVPGSRQPLCPRELRPGMGIPGVDFDGLAEAGEGLVHLALALSPLCPDDCGPNPSLSTIAHAMNPAPPDRVNAQHPSLVVGRRSTPQDRSSGQLETSGRQGSPRSSEYAGPSRADDQFIPYRSQATRRQCQPCGRCKVAAIPAFMRLPRMDVSHTGGGSRTHTGVSAQRILSPQRLPFRHAGSCGEVSTGRRCHKRKEPGRPGRFAIGAGPIRSRSDRSGGTPIHDQHGPHHRYRGIPLLRPIYLASQRPATDPRGSVRGSSRRRHRLS